MNPLLKKALSKLGLTSFNDLNPIEKETFKNWEVMLRGKKITDADVISELKTRLEKNLDALEDFDMSEKKKNHLLTEVGLIRLIVRTVESSKADVKRVEDEIDAL